MIGYSGLMAADLLVSNCDLDHVGQCAQELSSSGWLAKDIDANLDDAIKVAKSFSSRQISADQ